MVAIAPARAIVSKVTRLTADEVEEVWVAAGVTKASDGIGGIEAICASELPLFRARTSAAAPCCGGELDAGVAGVLAPAPEPWPGATTPAGPPEEIEAPEA